MKYIALLRGINVGGHRKILMKDLRALFEECGYTNITTYIQSGNVIFETEGEETREAIAHTIQEAIATTFSFDVPAIIITPQELETATQANPFMEVAEGDVSKLLCTFLNAAPELHHLQALEQRDIAPDQFQVIGRTVFLYCTGAFHKSKISNDLFEKTLHVRASTRNWKTVMKLLELSQ
jgi:uncharacterized protein (DUF1697 family)